MEHFHFMPGDYSDYFKNHFSPSFINIPDFLPDNQMFIRDEHGKQIEHPDHFLSRLVLEDFIDSEFSNLDYFTGLLLLLFKSSLKVKPFFRFSSFLEKFERSIFEPVRDISAMQKSTASGDSRNPLLLTRADFSPLATHNSTSPINKSFINSVPGAGTSSSSSSFTTSPLTTTTADFDLMTYINRNFGLNPLALSKLNFESAHLKTVENIASAASMLGATPGSDNGHNTPGSASKSTLQSSLVNAYLSQDNNGNLPPSPYNGQGGGGADVLNGDVVTQRKHNSSTNSNHPPINAAKVTPKTAVRSSKKSNSIGKGDSPASACVSCNICGKRFRTNLTLEIHVKSHKSSERPFPCKYCGRSFIQQTHVKQHERCHTNEKPYVCNFCDKSFAQKSGVIQHERIHTGEKPYICRFCPKSYRQMSGLKQHFTKHKDTDPVRDDLTEEELSKLKYPSLTASTSTASSIASNPQQGVKNLNNHSSKLLINNNNSDNNETSSTSGEKQTISQSPSFFTSSSSISNYQQQQSSSSQFNQQLTSQYFLSSPATSFHPLLTYGGGTNSIPNPLNNNNRHSQQNNSSSCSNNSSANHNNYKNGGGFPGLFHHHQSHNSPNAHSSNPYNNVMLAANIPPAAANYLLAADFLPPGIFFPPPPPSHPQGPGVGSCGGPSLDFNTITNAAFLFQQQQQQKMAAAAHQFNNNQQQHHNLAHHFQQQSNNNSNNNNTY